MGDDKTFSVKLSGKAFRDGSIFLSFSNILFAGKHNSFFNFAMQIFCSFGVDVLEALSATCTAFATGDPHRCDPNPDPDPDPDQCTCTST